MTSITEIVVECVPDDDPPVDPDTPTGLSINECAGLIYRDLGPPPVPIPVHFATPIQWVYKWDESGG